MCIYLSLFVSLVLSAILSLVIVRPELDEILSLSVIKCITQAQLTALEVNFTRHGSAVTVTRGTKGVKRQLAGEYRRTFVERGGHGLVPATMHATQGCVTGWHPRESFRGG